MADQYKMLQFLSGSLLNKDARAHCYCAFLKCPRYSLGTRVPRHVFQVRTKYRADDLCVNLVRKYFCWMLGDPHYFFGRSLPRGRNVPRMNTCV